ncbi:MAG TPA: hypothetical protein VGR08_04320, partial [Thermomicrobiales bacterium]|nr:hypothetical protein [Thermomicrobiales bacterium]
VRISVLGHLLIDVDLDWIAWQQPDQEEYQRGDEEDRKKCTKEPPDKKIVKDSPDAARAYHFLFNEYRSVTGHRCHGSFASTDQPRWLEIAWRAPAAQSPIVPAWSMHHPGAPYQAAGPSCEFARPQKVRCCPSLPKAPRRRPATGVVKSETP